MIMNRYLFVMALLYIIAVMFRYTDTDSRGARERL